LDQYLVNDYLTNLAARSVDPALALQPQLRSQFEPTPHTGGLNAVLPHIALPDETAFTVKTVEGENDPVAFRTRPNFARQARETIAPVPHETPATYKLIESVFNKSDESVIASTAKQSLSEKEIASSPEPVLSVAQRSRRAPRNDIRPTFQRPSDKVVTSPLAISRIDAVRPHAAMPDKATLAVEGKNEPPVRARHKLGHHTNEIIAPVAHINGSIFPAPQGTPVASQRREISSDESDESVIASAAKQSLPEKEIASSPVAPRNEIYPTFQTPSEKVVPSSPAFSHIGTVRPHTANPASTAAGSRAALDRPLLETVETKKTEVPARPSSRKNDTLLSRLAEERRTQTIKHEQLVVTEVIRQNVSDQGSILPRTVVMEESAKMHGRPQKPSAERQTQTISREQPIVTEVRQQNDLERGSIHPQATVTELPSKAHGHPQVQPAVFQPIIAQPRIIPFFENRHEDRLRHSDDREAPLTPTINVTIGRIEVRAAQPTSSSSPKRRPAPPVMSLDEYLRRRSNGGVG
jgi:hypothetical protein